MDHLLESLTEHVRRALDRSGAHAATVYVPTPWNDAEPAILVHVGPGVPLPELDSVASAVAFTQETAEALEHVDADGRTRRTLLPSERAGGCLVPIPLLTTLWQRVAQPRGPGGGPEHRRLTDRSAHLPVTGWIGFQLPDGTAFHGAAAYTDSMLELAAALASIYVCLHGMLTDPLTCLPGRAELQGAVRSDLEQARSRNAPYSLLFANPQGLQEVNEQHGRRAGDGVIREVVRELQNVLRRSDVVMRYGGAVFAVPLPDVPAESAQLVAAKISTRIAGRRFLDGNVQLKCLLGVATLEPGAAGIEPIDLIRRVDQALAAAQHTQTGIALWQAGDAPAYRGQIDRLLGIFTGFAEKDYRNMGLLWDVLDVISSSRGTDALAQAVVARLFARLSPSRVALFHIDQESLRLAAGRQRESSSGTGPVMTRDDIAGEEWELNEEAIASDAPVQRTLGAPAAGADAASAAFALPLRTDGRVLGSLYLVGDVNSLSIEPADLPVLSAVVAQLAMAWDREQLAEQRRQHEEKERRRLRAELHELRSALHQARLVFRSQAMTDLLTTARRVAATDTTVLVTGESGTGKEMLANALHRLSSRGDKPFIIVDCGAIAPTLVESELFGRERGAYTGADQRVQGRLAQAHGGTVFLDEIGELPLEVQAKLLRFVQEKTVSMVGSGRAHHVDVRIIAATNRNLEEEVRAGRFREDLFYRLNVVRLRIPPLRERADDVLFLAKHFVETFAVQYQKPVRGLDHSASERLIAYSWPGNVRELQNALLQAVVLTEGEWISAGDLRLADPPRTEPGGATLARAESAASEVETLRAQASQPPLDMGATMAAEAWRRLRVHLSDEMAAALAHNPALAPPLGKWLAHDCVLEAHRHAGHVVARAAALVGMPETTFARRLRQAEVDAVASRRSPSWDVVRTTLTDLVRASDRTPGSLVDQLDDVLQGLVLERVPDNVGLAAALLGVSAPTLKRRLASLTDRTQNEAA